MTHQPQSCKNNGEIEDERRHGFAKVGDWESNIYESHLVGLTLEDTEGQKKYGCG
jgi:hypothetical protein